MQSSAVSSVLMFPGEPQYMMTAAVGPDSDSASASPPQIDHATLRLLLKRQVEYYFSRENLNHDTYLVSQMDADQYVDIAIIAGFNQVKKLTSDVGLLVQVLKESTAVQVDNTETKVRPLHKRSVIILREIPEGTKKEEIEAMLTHDECPAFQTCEYATGNCWYIDFDTENEAQDAFRYLRETVKKFKGEDIKARIKAKPSAVSINATRQEQTQRTDLPSSTSESVRTQQQQPASITNSSISYPVQLQHIQLRNPQYYYQQPHITAGMPYVLPPAVLQPQWGMFPEGGGYVPYEISQAYPGFPPPGQQMRPSAPGTGTGQREWTGSSPRSNVNSTNGATGQEGTTLSTGSQNGSSTARSGSSHSSGYYSNSRASGDGPNYHRPANSGSGRNRNYTDNHSAHDRNFNHSESIPPRMRNNPGRDRNNREKRSGPHSQQHLSNGHNRRSTNHQSHTRGSSNSAANSGSGHLPRNGASSQHSGADSHRSDRANHSNRQSNSALQPAHNRNHGAHRNSKSPEKEIETNHDVEEPHTFALDSSAFPALPGATPATSSAAVNAISSDVSTPASQTSTSTAAETSDPANCDTKAGGVPVETEKVSKPETVAKLSDIVKNNLPEKVPELVRTPKVNVQHKEPSDKSSHTSGKSQGAAKAQGGQACQKSRPSSLPNGVHNDKPALSKVAHKTPTSSKPVQVEAAKPAEKPSSLVKKEPEECTAADAKDTATSQVSPSESKLSYSAVIQGGATKTSPNVEQLPAATKNPSAGDNNNNAESKPAANCKPDNPRAIAKNTHNNSAAQATRKSGSRGGGHHKPKKHDKSSPTSPPSRASSHTTAAVVAR